MFREVAFVAYHFHWSSEEIQTMTHRERRRWVDEIGQLNRATAGED